MIDDVGKRQFAIRLSERLGVSVADAERILDAITSLAEEDAGTSGHPRPATGLGYDGAFELPAHDFDFDKVSLGEN
jgi:hypothetical protein